ncbi:MAG: dTDP-4-dehydrorhamnose 3,5-epimerase [Gemmatimonadota bacterium]|nr:dTDP-4-dehydrorhamnose 3,5-epimerase [Gemmatimonadota bacterium]
MRVHVETTPIEDLLVVVPEVFEDERGFFMEVYHQEEFRKAGLPDTFVQLNHSRSARNVVRGLHFQWEPPMGKLMRVTLGTAYLVAVDIRKGSPTLGRWFGAEVSAASKRQIWAPAGFARGFCVLSEYAEIQYLCTGTYNKEGESGVLWNDPAIGVDWPVSDPILSEKDTSAQTLAKWLSRPESDNFAYVAR